MNIVSLFDDILFFSRDCTIASKAKRPYFKPLSRLAKLLRLPFPDPELQWPKPEVKFRRKRSSKSRCDWKRWLTRYEFWLTFWNSHSLILNFVFRKLIRQLKDLLRFFVYFILFIFLHLLSFCVLFTYVDQGTPERSSSWDPRWSWMPKRFSSIWDPHWWGTVNFWVLHDFPLMRKVNITP